MGHAAAGTAVITKQERTCVMPSVAERNRKPVPHELITSESVRGTKRRCLTAISRSPRVQSIVPNSLTSHDASFAWKRQAASHGRRISPDSAVANLDSACQKTVWQGAPRCGSFRSSAGLRAAPQNPARGVRPCGRVRSHVVTEFKSEATERHVQHCTLL
jgi:hypothetical protein